MVVAEESHPFCGVGPEINAEIASALSLSEPPLRRISGEDVPSRMRRISNLAIPRVEQIIAAVREGRLRVVLWS